MSLTAIALNATLKRSGGEPSSTDRMIGLIGAALGKAGVQLTETIRLADHDTKPGVSSDEGEGDAWPGIRARILAADLLVFGTPIWMGQPCSIAKRVCERMDAFLSETDQQGRTPAYGKVVLVGIVGNEDGAHHSSAELFQALNDVGWTVAPAAACYWVGEAMHKKNFKDLPEVPKVICETIAMATANAAHLAGALKAANYPGRPA
ncbi:MAG: flavodoxin family protein [Sphingomicrobium sp.]|nr:NAD(P)H-dependent oxidoreductase [Sphingomonadales bacterium]